MQQCIILIIIIIVIVVVVVVQGPSRVVGLEVVVVRTMYKWSVGRSVVVVVVVVVYGRRCILPRFWIKHLNMSRMPKRARYTLID